MLRYVIILVGVYIVYKLFLNDFIHKRRNEEEKEDTVDAQKVADGELIKDPVCGTYVAVQNSIRVKDGDKVHHFCSYDCRDKYIKQVEQGRNKIAASNKEAEPEIEIEVDPMQETEKQDEKTQDKK